MDLGEPEAELIARLRKGEHEAAVRLLTTYRPLVHAVMFARCLDLTRAAEREADVHPKLLVRLTEPSPPADVAAAVRELAAACAPPAEEAGPDGDHSLSQTEKVRVHRAFQGRVRALPEADRPLFVLRFVYRLPYAEIARLLGRGLGAVRDDLQRVHLGLLGEADRLEREEGIAHGLS